MEKYIRYALVGVIILIVIVFFSLVFMNSDASRLTKSMRYLRSGNLEEGLRLCDKITINEYSDKCYLNYLGRKINAGEPYDQSICDKISEARGADKEKLGCYV